MYSCVSHNCVFHDLCNIFKKLKDLIYFSIFLLARSPVYSHISATIQGLPTIRAYKEQVRFLNVHHFYQNEHTKAWFIKVAATRWFGMRLDMFGAVFITFLAFTSVPLADGK